jgi:hypothetical protein
MDRVSQHFAFYMRILTVVFAAVLAVALPIDSVLLYKTLSTDVKLRNGVLTNIPAIEKAADQLRKTENVDGDVESSLKDINTAALISVAQTLNGPLRQDKQKAKWPGKLVTIALLSLGAPFWFNQLKNLSNLRSTVAAKEQEERKAAEAAPATSEPARQAIAAIAERNEGEVR